MYKLFVLMAISRTDEHERSQSNSFFITHEEQEEKKPLSTARRQEHTSSIHPKHQLEQHIQIFQDDSSHLPATCNVHAVTLRW